MGGLPPITYLLASIAAGLFAVAIVATQPREKIVGRLGALALVVMIMLPFGLVTPAIRFAELPMMVFILAVIVVRRRSPAPKNIYLVLLGLYFLVTYISTNLAALFGSGLQYLVHLTFGLVFFLMGAMANKVERALLIKTFLGLALIQAVYAVDETFLQPPVLWASAVSEDSGLSITRLPSEIIPGLFRAQGTFGQPLILATFLSVALAFAGRYTFSHTWTRYVIAGVLFAGVIASGSRSALLVMGVVFIFSYGTSRIVVLRGLLIAVALYGSAWIFGFFESEIYQRFEQSGSVSHRQGALEAIPRLLGQSLDRVLLGNGWASQSDVFSRGLLQRDGFEAIDNQFVSTIVTSGLVGLVLIIALVVKTWLAASWDLRPAMFAIVAMYVVFDVHELPATWSMLMFIVGLVAHRSINNRTERKEHSHADTADDSRMDSGERDLQRHLRP